MAVHVARIALMQVDAGTGEIFRKDSTPMSSFLTKSQKPVTRPREWKTEHRVIEDTDIPSSAGSPTIKTYLEAENAAGFLFKHMDQTFIVTEGP